MRYVKARLEKEQRDEAYRIFVCDSLQLMPQNKYLAKRYSDLIKKDKEPQKSGDEIALDIMSRAGLKWK